MLSTERLIFIYMLRKVSTVDMKICGQFVNYGIIWKLTDEVYYLKKIVNMIACGNVTHGWL